MTTTAAYRRREVVVLVLGGAATVHFSHAFVKLAFQTQSAGKHVHAIYATAICTSFYKYVLKQQYSTVDRFDGSCTKA